MAFSNKEAINQSAEGFHGDNGPRPEELQGGPTGNQDTIKKWFDGCGYLDTTLNLRLRDCEALASRGESIGTVKRLRTEEWIEQQLQEIKPENLRKVLRGYGAWDDEELQDHEENLNRILWIAGCDVGERPDDYPTL